MTSKNFFCKQVLHIMQQNLWALALSVLGFIFCLPLPMGMMLQQYYGNLERYSNDMQPEMAQQMAQSSAGDFAFILGSTNMLVRVGVVIMALLLGVSLFRYLHDQRQIDLHHALPVRRHMLFLSRYVAGAMLTLPVLWLMRLFTVCIAYAGGVGDMVPLADVAFSLVSDSVFFLVIFGICALCTVLTGNTPVAVVLSLWYLLCVPAFVLLWEGLGTCFLSTTRMVSITGAYLITRMSPLIQYFALGCCEGNTISDSYAYDVAEVQYESMAQLMMMFAIVAILHIVAAVLLFRRRKSESAGQSIAFEWCKLPLKITLVVAAAFAGFLAFYALLENFAWGVFGLFFVGAIMHCFLEIVIQRDFKAIFSKKREMICILLPSLLLIVGMQTDIYGYDSYIPSASNLKGVSVRSYSGGEIGTANDMSSYSTTFMHDAENIENVIKLAEIGVKNAESLSYDGAYNSVYVTYERNFGLPVQRVYRIPSDENSTAILEQIRTSEEYQLQNDGLQLLDLEELAQENLQDTRLEIRTAATAYGDAAVAYLQGDEMLEALETLQNEALLLPYDQRTDEIPVMRVDLIRSEKDGYSANTTTLLRNEGVYASYSNTLALIVAETGVLPQSLTSADVQYIEIYTVDDAENIYLVEDIHGMQEEVASEYAAILSEEGISEAELEAEVKALAEYYGYFYLDAYIGQDCVKITTNDDLNALLQDALTSDMTRATDSAFTQDAQAAGYSIAAVRNNGEYVQLYYPKGDFPAEIIAKYVK